MYWIGAATEQIDVQFGLEETLIGVLLHQTLNASLSAIERFQRWIVDARDRQRARFRVEIHLFGSTDGDEVHVDFLRLGRTFRFFARAKFVAGEPEFEILFTEFGAQEGAE